LRFVNAREQFAPAAAHLDAARRCAEAGDDHADDRHRAPQGGPPSYIQTLPRSHRNSPTFDNKAIALVSILSELPVDTPRPSQGEGPPLLGLGLFWGRVRDSHGLSRGPCSFRLPARHEQGRIADGLP
jgi:hypothetical protein